MSTRIPDALTKEDVQRAGWNRVRVVATGRHFVFSVNGTLAAEFTDNARTGRLDRGAIGLQIHDKGMRVEFKEHSPEANLARTALTKHYRRAGRRSTIEPSAPNLDCLPKSATYRMPLSGS